MVSKHLHSGTSQRPSVELTFASALALLSIALASEYLFPSSKRRSEESQPIRGGAGKAADERGRQSMTPSEIPGRGWKDILLRVYSNISKHRILALAAGMTYYSILAIFPAIAALVVAVYGLFSDPSTIARHLDQLGGFLPDGPSTWRANSLPGGFEAIADSRSYVFGGTRRFAVEFQCRDESSVRHAEHCPR
jgi:hypothetical protein